jgi:hypothetical protein
MFNFVREKSKIEKSKAQCCSKGLTYFSSNYFGFPIDHVYYVIKLDLVYVYGNSILVVSSHFLAWERKMDCYGSSYS